jgi:hypothetical protein
MFVSVHQVYGFDTVELKISQSEISVRVITNL